MRSWFQPKLRSILILTHVLVLLLPLLGISFLKIYDNALVRQTQAELLSQAALVATLFADKIDEYQSKERPYTGLPLSPTPKTYEERAPESIDMKDAEILPTQPDPDETEEELHPVAEKAGEAVSRILRRSKELTLTGTRVVDIHGVIAASSAWEDDQGLSLALLPEIQNALKGIPSLVLRKRPPLPGTPAPELASLSRGSRLRLYLCLPVFGENQVLGAVLLSRTPLDTRKALYEKRYGIVTALALFLMVVLMVSLISAYFVTRPLGVMLGQAEKLARGEKDWNARGPGAATEELERLGDAFESMAGTLEKRADYIKQFAIHVSHEFKTPLSSLRGSIELLQDHWETMPSEKRLRFLGNIAKDSERLERLVSRLMELAIAEVRAPRDEATPLGPVLESLRARYEDLGLSVLSSAPAGLSLVLPGDLLETVLSNLLNNSQQHGARSVAIQASLEGDLALLNVSDDGPGISQANAEKIFTPFFTTQRERGGTGLGLTIVKTLLEAQQGSIQVLPSAKGASFLLKIPAAKV